VHDYLTVDGRRLSKSAGTAVDPADLVARFGTDPVRWWLLREVSRNAETDFTVNRLIECAKRDLAGGLGNLVHRVTTMAHRYRDGRPSATGTHSSTVRLRTAGSEAAYAVTNAITRFDFRTATGALRALVDEANRVIEDVRPWELAEAERSGEPEATPVLDGVLHALIDTCRTLGELLAPFLPGTAQRLVAQCTPIKGRLPAPGLLFERISFEDTER
jgi:methionyl-tRNA synthetase